jgi:hypothetical protein
MFVGPATLEWKLFDKTTLLEFYTDQKTILAFQTILSHIFSSWSLEWTTNKTPCIPQLSDFNTNKT